MNGGVTNVFGRRRSKWLCSALEEEAEEKGVEDDDGVKRFTGK